MNIHIEELKRKANALPATPGIYLMKDAHGSIVYVGKAKSLKARVVSYFRKNQQHTSKTIRMVHNITDFDTIGVDTELDALLLECQLIKNCIPCIIAK
ncbi:GIY-YIG nuclease family protein [Enterococcus sp.]|uniref:GIY-YIG nuclease family protein n=1 Tax=Enterococcus sp. TaxID=35783 RepID=UPI0028963A28|nr:GIY-YIG nuclease family protein [Enterococcus sp.]